LEWDEWVMIGWLLLVVAIALWTEYLRRKDAMEGRMMKRIVIENVDIMSTDEEETLKKVLKALNVEFKVEYERGVKNG